MIMNVEFTFNELRCSNLAKAIDKVIQTGRIDTETPPLLTMAIEQHDDSNTLAYLLIVLTDTSVDDQGQEVKLNVKAPFYYCDGPTDPATDQAKMLYLDIIRRPSRVVRSLSHVLASHGVSTLRLQSFDAATGQPLIDELDTHAF